MTNQIALFIDFENVALWAEQEFLDLDLTALIEFLQRRGPVVIKRAYGDWGRFSRYRDQLMDNAIDLIQIYSVRAGKNRADIRMALDAFEHAITRKQIGTFVIVSGDSDFGPLINKLRAYNGYTLGIGPRDVTHPLLVKACDEFIYLETILEGEDAPPLSEIVSSGNEDARTLLLHALRLHEQQDNLPVPADQLKQTILALDPTFGEMNFGHAQFKSWLEYNTDIVQLIILDMQLFVDLNSALGEAGELAGTLTASNGQVQAAPPRGADQLVASSLVAPPTKPLTMPTIRAQYQQILSRLKMTGIDFATRRDVLRDIYRELTEEARERTTDSLLEELCERYEQQGLIRSKTTLRQIWQMGFRQHVFAYADETASVHVPVHLAEGIDSEAAFVRRAEAGFVHAVINAGLPIDREELALILLNDEDQADYIQTLLDDLVERNLVLEEEGRYTLPGEGAVPFCDEPVLQPVCSDIRGMTLPENVVRSVDTARQLAKTAMYERSQDFAASARSYLRACRVQWEAVEQNAPGATLEDLRWYMASYASVRAGELSQIHRDYANSRPYYLAFFSLVREDDPLWSRMRGLINPMLSYYWVNAWRELGLNAGNPNGGNTTPADIAVHAAIHDDPKLCNLWYNMTSRLAQVNPGLIQRVANQIRLSGTESPVYTQVAESMEQMLME